MVMKKIILILLLTAACLSLAYPQERRQIIEDKINVRVDSRVSSDSLGYLLKGDNVEVLEEKYGWCKIVLPKKFSAYIAKSLGKKVSSDKIKLTAGNVNLRSKPSLYGHIIGVAPEGSVFKLVSEKKQWWKVRAHPYAKGWVHKKFTTKDQSLGLDSKVQRLLSKVSKVSPKEKGIYYRKLIQEGKKIIPVLEAKLNEAEDDLIYSIIWIIGRLGEGDLDLASRFLDKIDKNSPRISAIYLDILTSILKPFESKNAYFYLYQKSMLSESDIESAKNKFNRLYRRKIK